MAVGAKAWMSGIGGLASSRSDPFTAHIDALALAIDPKSLVRDRKAKLSGDEGQARQRFSD